ncbi:DNA helicase [Arthrobacter sp. Leaf234]|uniref:DEAD/DEAH box helicase n=1 Tax=Arthrobacter sp. Leaf234 TaxID=1736303 RepID=UPI0006F647A0|nr:DEAD/DEAH box helicase [Arthrobacter sp. Leaf234]KQO03983.1 DNA helicase [Arthrobacter sp. Leaf234]
MHNTDHDTNSSPAADAHHLVADNSEDAIDVEETLVTTEEPHAPVAETFADFNVRPDIVESLADAGITHPFPIQAMTLSIALGGHDIIGQAKTGTGKTLGFGIPAIQRVVGPDDAGYEKLPVPGAPQALVVVPTRELAVQVAGDLTTAAKKRNARIVTIYGGRAYEPQIEAIKRGVEIVVGTPGRLIDLYRQKLLVLKNVKIVVLDEADEMLDLGFLPDVETLIAATPPVRQTLLFSATMPGPVIAMARRYMTQPTHIRAADPEDEGITKKDIRQVIYRAHNLDKAEVVARILQSRNRGRTIIFCKTKRTAAKLSEELIDRGFAAGAIHGDLGQGAREQALRAFRGDKIDVLVATEVAARGIDVEDITHVINYQCPEDEKAYLHRVGRTGRAGKKGTAVTFVDWDDVPRWGLINKALGLDAPEPVETYSSSPHLYTDLDIPVGTKGRLPRKDRKLAGINAETLEDLGETGKRGGGRPDGAGGAAGAGGRGQSRDGGRGGQSRDGAAGGQQRDSGRGSRGRGRGGRGADSNGPAESTSSAAAPAATGAADPEGGRRRRAADAVSGETAAGDRPRRSRTRRRNGEVVGNPAGGSED